MDPYPLTRRQGAPSATLISTLAAIDMLTGIRPIGYRKDGTPIWPMAGGDDRLNTDLNSLRSVEELAAYQTEVRSRITELNVEYIGLPFPDEAREEFARLQEQDTEIEARSTELRARQSYIERMAQSGRTESVSDDSIRSVRATRREEDIYDLSTIPQSFSDRSAGVREMRGRAMRATELANFPHQRAVRSDVQAHIERLLANDDDRGSIARRILTTGNPTYQRAFVKTLQGAPLTSEEARAMSLTGASGGFAVPFQLDPTIIPTSNGTVNPFRQIARVVQTTTDEWRGISSGAIAAAYEAEATETTDNSPTLANPAISTEKAQAFIPFSIEIGMDWGSLQAEMSGLLQDAKDDLEAAKFSAGSGVNEPFGFITGATNVVNAATGQTFAVPNLYALEEALPPRYRARASFVGNRAIYNRTRQFDTQGGASLWITLGQGLPNSATGALGQALLGYPTYEASAMEATPATGNKFLTLGDFSRFVIVDRIGLDIELIPHLFGVNRRPTGQRGLYAYWRNGSKVVDANAFRTLVGVV